MKNIHLENDSCVVRILPERGGKICTFLDKANDFQVAAVTDRPYLPVGEDSFFSESDMSGIDDAFPNVKPETIQYGGRTLRYPDHGEIWSHAMTPVDVSADHAILEYQSARLQYRYRKSFSLHQNQLSVVINIANTGRDPLYVSWSDQIGR